MMNYGPRMLECGRKSARRGGLTSALQQVILLRRPKSQTRYPPPSSIVRSVRVFAEEGADARFGGGEMGGGAAVGRQAGGARGFAAEALGEGGRMELVEAGQHE